MTQATKYPSGPLHMSQTFSFGAHRYGDRPASAVEAGASSMPAAWQTRSAPAIKAIPGQHESVRSFADMALDPLRWMTATKAHKIGSAIVLGTLALIVLL